MTEIAKLLKSLAFFPSRSMLGFDRFIEAFAGAGELEHNLHTWRMYRYHHHYSRCQQVAMACSCFPITAVAAKAYGARAQLRPPAPESNF